MREHILAALEAVGAALALAAFGAALIYMLPEQRSAEADLCASAHTQPTR